MAFTKTPPACPQKSAQGILPEFSYRGLILQAENLRYAPHPDIIFPSVIATDSRWEKPLGKFHLYYAPHDEPGGICLAYADSPVGPWTEYNQNPLIQKSWPPHYEVSHVSSPHAVWNEEENRLFLYFHGENNTTRYAVSRDGVHFTYGDVAVNTDMLGANLVEASYARVFRHLHDSGRMRYAMIVMGNKQGTRNLYVASSPDGRKWQARTEPLVTPPPGTNQTGAGWLFSHQEKLYLLDFANQDDSHQYYPLSNLYLHELDTELTHAEFKGLLIHHKAVGEDNCRINDPCLLVHHGTVYLYVNLGKRRHQQIGLMTAILS